MIPAKATVLRRLLHKPPVRVGIEAVKVGQYIRCIKLSNGDYVYARVASIVKLSLPRYELTTTQFESIICTSSCKFFSVDGFKLPWSPGMTFDHNTRLVKRDASKLMFPFIKACKRYQFEHTFYDIMIECEDVDVAVIVDGYAKIYHTTHREKNGNIYFGKSKNKKTTEMVSEQSIQEESPVLQSLGQGEDISIPD